MATLTKRFSNLILIGVTAAVVLMVAYANWRDARRSAPPRVPAIGAPGGSQTSPEGLSSTITSLEAALADNPANTAAAVVLAEALMRQARVKNDAALAVRAEKVVRKALGYRPEDYAARRTLGTVLLAQHRFEEAIEAAQRARKQQPRDAYNYGVMGDGYLELGDYDRAFDAFDTMSKMRPSASTYARVAYARELQGDLAGALQNMRMAAEATTAHDPESQAWHFAQIGNLLFQLGRVAEAKREYQRAAFTFARHPYAMVGLAKVKAAEGDARGALAAYLELLRETPTPELAASAGDLYARLGNHAEAGRHYVMAERLEREGWKTEAPQPAALARFLAQRDRKIDEAVRLAEQAASTRRDIFTEDALAWAYFKAGRIKDARAASVAALRTGTRDRRLLYHAAAIRKAAGDLRGARELVERALDGHPQFDPLVAPAAAALRESLAGRSL